jgi:hypothetical protein
MSQHTDILARMSVYWDIPGAQSTFMQLYDIFSSPKSTVAQALQKFRVLIEKQGMWHPTEDVQFVFLCGANIAPQVPSKRRQILLEFSSKHLPHTKFFLAESMFKVLEAEGHRGNVLDIEDELSRFADYVIIVLESESSFCELGAFATHNELRKKLIIINDWAHRSSKSFINLGPIQAVREISTGNHVLHYKMENDGKIYGDGIGDVFRKLHILLHKKPKTRRTRVNQYDPNKYFTKESLRFMHDLVYFSSPVSFPELSRLVKLLFDKAKDKQLLKHLGLLCAIEQTQRTEKNLYKSIYNKPYFQYDTYDIYSMIAGFRNLYLRNDPSRFV